MSLFANDNSLSALINRPRPSRWALFLKEPCVFIARTLYSWRYVLPSDPINPITVVCISDTHNSQPPVPAGDILIHAGDLTQSGTQEELAAAIEWLKALPHAHKILVGGNHDALLDKSFTRHRSDRVMKGLDWGDLIYLERESVVVSCSNGRRISIYGSPMSPRHGNWAFQYPRTEDIWTNTIPSDLDILITHGPPKGHLDCGGLGCAFLLREIWRVKPKLHVFGHVHEGHGKEWIPYSVLQEAYEATVVMRGGLSNMIWTVWMYLRVRFAPPTKSSTLLVNAAQVGGLRDEVKRAPIVVRI
ncbi:putative phosphoesterase [Pseudovirgaria hyperparasitica]|uniref:Putative phosphoesterase n=1 Tax=Pseudovirgaria hyperparasitica TaxID=470096 RepID=A0A6A6WFA5_9PEZI|nr:putative phosphoesterase [Pseudovirgaria hyperparasitica]KAF2761225.1 putative phosphoesterase [Pseudovirgaria hyperparasitica]